MCKTNEDTRYVTACSSGCPLRFRNSTRHLFRCRERLRARSYRLRVAVVFVHAFGFELVAGGFEASLGFASLGSVSRVFEGLSAFRSAFALRFGYHIPATAPNPQTRFALAHRASQSHGPFKRHEESLPFLVSPAVFSKWESGLESGCECMRGGRIQRGSARCALTLRRGTQKSLGHSPVEPFRPTAVSGGRINNPERALNLFRGLSAACESRRLPGGSVSVPSDIGSAFFANCQRSGSRSEGPRHNYQGSHRPLAKAGVAGNGLLERSVLSLTGGARFVRWCGVTVVSRSRGLRIAVCRNRPCVRGDLFRVSGSRLAQSRPAAAAIGGRRNMHVRSGLRFRSGSVAAFGF